jgi:hypothetical protein
MLSARQARLVVPAALERELVALFREARMRRRRRWLAGIGAVALASFLTAAATLASGDSGPGQRGASGGSGGVALGGQTGPAVVWVDDTGRLHVGRIRAGGAISQRVVGEANAASEPLLAAGRRVFWVNPAGRFVPSLGHWSQVIQELNLRTDRVRVAGAGQTVFLSADGRSLPMSQMPTSLAQMPVTGGRPHVMSLPRGWYLPGGDGLADALEGQGLDTADGVLVQSREAPGIGARRIAVWNPATGTVRVLGRAREVIDVYTPPGGRYSLLAWLPAGTSDALKITNTASGAVTTVRSPSGAGFAFGGALAPDGRSLAVFVNAPSLTSARLALLDPATGVLRFARAPSVALGMDYGWARWLPGGSALIAGAGPGGVLVSARTLTARPLHRLKGKGMTSVNYTSVLVPFASGTHRG